LFDDPDHSNGDRQADQRIEQDHKSKLTAIHIV
jgi:hypothetical protein